MFGGGFLVRRRGLSPVPADEFTCDDARTGLRAHLNMAESAHSMFRRAIIGVWHQIGGKHMGGYLREVAFCWNNGGVGNAARYRALIVRLRSMLKTRFNAVLSRIVRLHAPAEVVERLNFRSATLARSGGSMRVNSAVSPRFPNPYIREWASVAGKLLPTQDPVRCGQK